MRNQIMMKKRVKIKKNCGAKAGLAACALCLLILTGCGDDTVKEPQSFAAQEVEQGEAGKTQTGENTSWPEETNQPVPDNSKPETGTDAASQTGGSASADYALADVDALLGDADAQGSIEKLTEEGCLFAPYTVLEDSTMMVSQTENAAEHLEEVKADENTEYVVVHIDTGAGTATSVENGGKSSLREGDSIYIQGEMGTDGVWMAERIVVTVMD